MIGLPPDWKSPFPDIASVGLGASERSAIKFSRPNNP